MAGAARNDARRKKVSVELGRIAILPGNFPYCITGAIAESGGAWNASIVSGRLAGLGRPPSLVRRSFR